MCLPMIDDRPAVIRSPFNPVDLITAERAMLRLDQPAAARFEVESLRLAVAIAPDLSSLIRMPRDEFL